MVSQAAFTVSMVALFCTLLTALHALARDGLAGLRFHKKSIYLAFSVYVLSFTFFLVTQ